MYPPERVPDMSNVIAIVNPKGGVGKTTTALNVAAGLLRYSDITSSVLAIDLDPHGCMSSAMLGKVDGKPPARSIFDVMRRAITPHDGITSTVFQENIDILPVIDFGKTDNQVYMVKTSLKRPRKRPRRRSSIGCRR